MIRCKEGHEFAIKHQLVEQLDWPKDCPRCPICAQKWLMENGYSFKIENKIIRITGRKSDES